MNSHRYCSNIKLGQERLRLSSEGSGRQRKKKQGAIRVVYRFIKDRTTATDIGREGGRNEKQRKKGDRFQEPMNTYATKGKFPGMNR